MFNGGGFYALNVPVVRDLNKNGKRFQANLERMFLLQSVPTAIPGLPGRTGTRQLRQTDLSGKIGSNEIRQEQGPWPSNYLCISSLKGVI